MASPLRFLLPALTLILAASPRAHATTGSTTTLAASATTIASGSVLTLTATVSNGVSSLTAGQVKFCDSDATYCVDAHLLGSAQITPAGTAVLRFIPGIGTHHYKAVFTGTLALPTSTSTVSTIAVTGTHKTTTALTTSGTTGNYTLNAAIAGSGGLATPTGTVAFADTTSGSVALGTAPLVSGLSSLSWTNSLLTGPLSGSIAPVFALGDFNGDGKIDIAQANGAGILTVLLGNGDGTFSAGPVSTITDLYTLATGDFNGDGKLDLVATTSSSSAVQVLLGNGDGTFTLGSAPFAATAPTYIAVADFNNDGIADLAVATSNSALITFLGNGDGTFTRSKGALSSPNRENMVASGDFNGDGKIDLAVTNSDTYGVQVLMGVGDGSFTTGPLFPQGTGFTAVGDFNGDGRSDLVVTSAPSATTITIELGNADGTFTPMTSTIATYHPTCFAVGDFNLDGKLDLAASTSNGPQTMTVLLGNGDGTFTSSPGINTSASTKYLATADLDGDGVPDVVVQNTPSASAVLLTQSSSAATASLANVSLTSAGAHTVVATYSGDTSYGTSVSAAATITIQPIAPTISFTVANRAYGTAPFTIVATSNSSGAFTYSLVSGPATVSGTTVTLTGVGTVVLQASEAASTDYTTGTLQATFTVSKGTPGVALASSVNPVLVQNSVGLTTTLSSAAGTPTGTVTFMDGATALGTSTIANGSATLAVTTLTVGSHSITATYSGDTNFAGGTSNTVTETVQDLTLALGSGSTTSQTISAGGTATYTLALSPSGGTTFPSAITFSASGLPTGATATFSPTTITAGSGATNVTLTIQTVKASAVLAPVGGFVLAMLLLPFRMKRRMAKLMCVGMLMAGATIGMTGCGGSSPTTSTPQTSTITVTATSGSLSKTTTVTLIVQ